MILSLRIVHSNLWNIFVVFFSLFFLALFSSTEAKEIEHVLLLNPVAWDRGTTPAQPAEAAETVSTKPQGARAAPEGRSPGLPQTAIPPG